MATGGQLRGRGARHGARAPHRPHQPRHRRRPPAHHAHGVRALRGLALRQDRKQLRVWHLHRTLRRRPGLCDGLYSLRSRPGQREELIALLQLLRHPGGAARLQPGGPVLELRGARERAAVLRQPLQHAQRAPRLPPPRARGQARRLPRLGRHQPLRGRGAAVVHVPGGGPHAGRADARDDGRLGHVQRGAAHVLERVCALSLHRRGEHRGDVQAAHHPRGALQRAARLRAPGPRARLCGVRAHYRHVSAQGAHPHLPVHCRWPLFQNVCSVFLLDPASHAM